MIRRMGRGGKLLLALCALLALPGARVAGLIGTESHGGTVETAAPATVAAPPASPDSNLVAGRPSSLATLPTTPTSVPPTTALTTTPPTSAPPATAPPTVGTPVTTHLVAHARSSGINVYTDPAATRPSLYLPPITEFGTPRALLAVEGRGEWIRVLLPVRPNNATGWVRFKDVDVTVTTDEVHVSLAERTMTWFRDGQPVVTSPVAVGAAGSPTPSGSYYVTDVIGGGGAFGPALLALNGHSDTYTEFAGGDARLALHGTNDPASIGLAASHGCVRLPNDLIVELAQSLGPGTPVFVA